MSSGSGPSAAPLHSYAAEGFFIYHCKDFIKMIRVCVLSGEKINFSSSSKAHNATGIFT